MTRRVWLGVPATVLVLVALYLALWPVPVEPAAWRAPPNPGYTGPYAPNERLDEVEPIPLGAHRGPEDVAVHADGSVYTGTEDGWILRVAPDGGVTPWVNTAGRPLGMEWDRSGNLVVADALTGLLAIAPDGTISRLVTSVAGVPVRYANDVDVARDGRIYFSDVSTKFHPGAFGGTYEASFRDLVEHGGHGRLLAYDPASGASAALLAGLNNANGVAVAHDQASVLVNEMGSYRVLRVWVAGPDSGRTDVLIDALPGFPDNISAGRDGRYWIAFASPRNALADRLAGRPSLRKLFLRIPAFLRPAAVPYGHVIAVDDSGRVVANLQDPDGAYPVITSATEADGYLYLGNLWSPALARLALGGGS